MARLHQLDPVLMADSARYDAHLHASMYCERRRINILEPLAMSLSPHVYKDEYRQICFDLGFLLYRV